MEQLCRIIPILFLLIIALQGIYAFDSSNNNSQQNQQQIDVQKATSRTTTRRVWINDCSSMTIGGHLLLPTLPVHATDLVSETKQHRVETIRVPLVYVPKLSSYVVYYTIGGDKFGAIVDTGSPFLTIPSYCNTGKAGAGCYRPTSSIPSGFLDTYERFDNNEGPVEWRNSTFAFVNATGSMIGPKTFTFGVLSENLMDGSGGVFFGLVRDTKRTIRPSFLGQTNVRAFQIDLSSSSSPSLTLTSGAGEDLVLSSSSSSDTTTNPQQTQQREIPTSIKLVNDLSRKYGDPTNHYTARAKTMLVNGRPLGRGNKPIYVIFDTGVTGMVVSRELFNERYDIARTFRERNLWGNVTLTFSNGTVLSSTVPPITTPLGNERPWPKFTAYLVIVGLAFLDKKVLTVDIDQQKLWLT